MKVNICLFKCLLMSSSLLVGSCGETNESGSATPEEDSGQVKEQPIIKTSIDELLDAYAGNQLAASRRFGHSPIQLSGKVVRVREAFGTGILVLRSSVSGTEQEFGFSDKGTKMLAFVSPGDRVTVTCPTVIEAMGIVVVGGCSEVVVR